MHTIPYSKVSCSGNEMKYLQQVIESGWLTTASKTFEFEKQFAGIVGADHALAVNSCTAGLHLALDALGVGAGDKVFVPTMTFTASAEVIRYMGADPVFLDVDYGTRLITPEILQTAIKKHPDVKTLIIVHFGGQSADMGAIVPLCQQHGIRIVEDAAHAFPAKDGDAMVGTIGDITCFSFYANKTMTTGEGGMITTNNSDYAKRIKVMRTHGIDRDSFARFTSTHATSDKPSWQYDVVAPGFKYNMPDTAAAIGLAQLERLYDMRDARARVADYYNRALADNPHIDCPQSRVPSEDHAWHLYSIVIKPNSPVNRDTVIAKLADAGIGTSVHYTPIHRLSYYQEKYNLNPQDYAGAEAYFAGCISLPIYADLTAEELQYIVETIDRILNVN